MKTDYDECINELLGLLSMDYESEDGVYSAFFECFAKTLLCDSFAAFTANSDRPLILSGISGNERGKLFPRNGELMKLNNNETVVRAQKGFRTFIYMPLKDKARLNYIFVACKPANENTTCFLHGKTADFIKKAGLISPALVRTVKYCNLNTKSPITDLYSVKELFHDLNKNEQKTFLSIYLDLEKFLLFGTDICSVIKGYGDCINRFLMEKEKGYILSDRIFVVSSDLSEKDLFLRGSFLLKATEDYIKSESIPKDCFRFLISSSTESVYETVKLILDPKVSAPIMEIGIRDALMYEEIAESRKKLSSFVKGNETDPINKMIESETIGSPNKEINTTEFLFGLNFN